MEDFLGKITVGSALDHCHHVQKKRIREDLVGTDFDEPGDSSGPAKTPRPDGQDRGSIWGESNMCCDSNGAERHMQGIARSRLVIGGLLKWIYRFPSMLATL